MSFCVAPIARRLRHRGVEPGVEDQHLRLGEQHVVAVEIGLAQAEPGDVVDRAHALRKNHLTARQAGQIAQAVGARAVVPFHFSPRYGGRAAEVAAAPLNYPRDAHY